MTTLAQRMKRYEHAYRQYLPPRTYTLLRLDGRAFHTYTRDMHRPFDDRLVKSMNETAEALCREIVGAQFAYVQSDEISLLVTDFNTHTTEPWMGGNIAKVLSLSASVATAEFNAAIDSEYWGYATFDSRVWTMSDAPEVANYFIWRQRDCVKNSITMSAQAHCSHKELEGLNSNQRQELLFRKSGINWNDLPADLKRGRVVVKETYDGPEDSVRTRWLTQAAPNFVVASGEWITEKIPALPALEQSVDICI